MCTSWKGSGFPGDGNSRFNSTRKSSCRSTAEKRSTASSVVTGTFIWETLVGRRGNPPDKHVSRDTTNDSARARVPACARKRCPIEERETYLMEDLVLKRKKKTAVMSRTV